MKKSLWIFYFIFLSLVVGPTYSWAQDDSELDEVISELSSSNEWTRWGAARELGTTYKGNEKAFNALCGRLVFEFDPWPREAILEALGNHENPKAFSSITRLLDYSFSPEWPSLFTWDDTRVIEEAMTALGKIRNKEAVSYIFEYFSSQGGFYGTFPLGWYHVRYEAAHSLEKLIQEFSEQDLRVVYNERKYLLTTAALVERPFYDMSLFAHESAWVFLKTFSSRSDVSDLSSEVLSTMTENWKKAYREGFVRLYLSQENLIISLKGTLEDQGKFIGRLGQFRLKNNGKDVIQVYVDPARINELYRHVGKEVVIRGELKSRRGRSKLYPFVDDAYPMWIELGEIR